VRAVFDDIMKTRTDYINNIGVPSRDHAVLKALLGRDEAVMVCRRLDPLTKELLYLAVSVTNNCEYCIASHTFAARKHGLDDEMLAELTEVIALATRAIA
jgi:AhpD family alkylhydroperoxidase